MGSDTQGRDASGVRERRRSRANTTLIIYRERAQRQRNAMAGANFQVWEKLLVWQLEWENAILRYRDSNNGEDE